MLFILVLKSNMLQRERACELVAAEGVEVGEWMDDQTFVGVFEVGV